MPRLNDRSMRPDVLASTFGTYSILPPSLNHTKMPQSLRAPSRRVVLEHLNPDSFAPFGSVVENPLSSSSNLIHSLQSIQANQGSARRWLDVTNVTNFYSLSLTKKPSRLTVSLFVCSPRKLRVPSVPKSQDPIRAVPNAYPTSWAQSGASSDEAAIFDIEILERHPFTSQTFIPMGLGKENRSTQYLVIVAPTLPSSTSRKETKQIPRAYPSPDPKPKGSAASVFSRARPSPYDNSQQPPSPSSSPTGDKPKGPGLPDLNNIRAFIANGNQAVTYGAGTWHAPMVVVGRDAVEFAVVQHVNGVSDDDCQEVVLTNDAEGLSVAVDIQSIPWMTNAKL